MIRKSLKNQIKMKRFTIIPLLAVGFLLLAQSIYAEVKLPAIVSSNMVLQRNTTVVLWGWADAKEKISIKVSWLEEPLKARADNEGNWNVADFSAVAYYFGQQLQEILDVPVGLIHTSWGGSSVQPWISKEVISEYQELNLANVDITIGANQTAWNRRCIGNSFQPW